MSDHRAIQRRLDSYRRRLKSASNKFDVTSAIDRRPLKLAGRFFDLDLKDPILRDWLLYILADVLFGRRQKGRPSGSNTAWDFDRYFYLQYLYHAVKRDNPKLSNAKIAELICEFDEFKNNDPEQVRQHIGRALREHAKFERRRRASDKKRARLVRAGQMDDRPAQ
jgi:hypothetical protein